MKAKHKENDKVWIRISGARPKQVIVKNIELVYYQNHNGFVYTFNNNLKRIEDEIWKNKKGILWKN